MTPEPLRLVKQTRGHGDCAFASMATVCGTSYQHVIMTAARTLKRENILEFELTGIHGTEVVRVARKLEKPLKVVVFNQAEAETEDLTCILDIKGRFNGEKYENHMVVYHAGRVFDLRDLTSWDYDHFMTHYAGTVDTCWVRVEHKRAA